MELAVIILFVLSIAVLSALWGRFEKRRAANPKPEAGASSGADGSGGARPARPARPRPAPAATGTSPQAARDAAALLSADQHRQIYAALGQGQPVKALKLYAMFTGAGIRASGAAITNMAAHPQPYVRPIPDPESAAKPDTAKPDAAKPDAAKPAAGAESEAVREEEISKWAQQLRPEDFLKP
ncbi:hypothetical protein NNX28_14980 [Arthrobacter sp. zg-Y859]|uniref:Uncharacterized protein n=1 Tax=Arthrobacter jinronghuae TaxID=2964609 RepID=A0ABT1NU52_9MICC|nr:hypothetical protein [Arthrobacter jinronghuae]MCQ1951223.1 hypothetical protein [Arthrobacter jinronghuae]UWX79003.1 hypothetical protein N2K98_01930 [Arthrobacter jinronghuae]